VLVWIARFSAAVFFLVGPWALFMRPASTEKCKQILSEIFW